MHFIKVFFFIFFTFAVLLTLRSFQNKKRVFLFMQILAMVPTTYMIWLAKFLATNIFVNDTGNLLKKLLIAN